MKFVFYTHSIVSDWNHGNAHFLRGVIRELVARGHEVLALEPEDSWSRENLLREAGPEALAAFAATFPEIKWQTYGRDADHAPLVDDADVVIVHEWTDPALVAHLGALRRHGRFALLFHDTHHRVVSAEGDMASLALADYDGVLAFGATLAERYRKAGWGRAVFVWHEAADARLFRPLPDVPKDGDLIWVGNWGDGERVQELDTFLIGPAKALGLTATIRGVRYPETAQAALREAGITYGGWIANADVPRAFAAHRMTVHVPRRPYVEALPGIPTIRMFEALAAGIPLVSAPWDDCEGLFRQGEDFLMVRNGAEMARRMEEILNDGAFAAALARSGRETILRRHTCAYRVDELLAMLGTMGVGVRRHEGVPA